MTDKKAQTPVDIIAGVIVIIGGTLILTGNINLGGVVATVGLLIEGVKILINQGL